MALSREEVFIQKVLKRLYAETSSSPVRASSGKEEAVLINLGSKSKENDLENVQALSADAGTSSGTLSKSSRGTVLELKRTVRHGIVEGEMKIPRDAVLCDYMLIF